MAAKDTVSNVFGGFTIFTDQPFKINDGIKIEDYDGMVIEIGIRRAHLKTLEGGIVAIPDARFADAPVENISWESSKKIKLGLGLACDTSPEKMQQPISNLLSRHKRFTSCRYKLSESPFAKTGALQ